MPEIISYHDRDDGVQRTVNTMSGMGLRKVANVLTLLVVLAALPVTLIAVQQINTVKQRASGSTIKITAGTVTTSQTPWLATITGDNFSPLMQAKIFDGETVWGNNLPVIFDSGTKLSIQFPTNKPPSNCIVGQNCNFSIQLIDPSSNFSSNKLPLTVQ